MKNLEISIMHLLNLGVIILKEKESSRSHKKERNMLFVMIKLAPYNKSHP
jgi:hypothetical protein